MTVLLEKFNTPFETAPFDKINQNDSKLQFYIQNYITLIAFSASKKNVFKVYKDNKIFLHNSSIFDKNSCIIFLTLINEIGKIKHA